MVLQLYVSLFLILSVKNLKRKMTNDRDTQQKIMLMSVSGWSVLDLHPRPLLLVTREMSHAKIRGVEYP